MDVGRESGILCGIRALVGAVTRLLLAQPFPLSRSAQILVSLGAGIYEEFVFRVLLLGALVFSIVSCISSSWWHTAWRQVSVPFICGFSI